MSRGDAEVTGQCEITTSSGSNTIDCGDHRLGHLPNTRDNAPSGTENASKLFAIMPLHQLSHKVDVAAGAECAPRACDHNHANTAIASRRLERFSQVSTHMSDEGIQLVRTIDRDRHNAEVFCDQEVFVHF